MTTRIILLCLLVCSQLTLGQSITGINFSSRYDPRNEINLKVALVNEGDRLMALYSIESSPGANPAEYLIQWERRDSYNDRKGVTLKSDTIQIQAGSNVIGNLSLTPEEKPWLLLGTITNQSTEYNTHIVKVIESNYPLIASIKNADKEITGSFVKSGQSITINASASGQPLYLYHYGINFPSALPPFALKSSANDPLMLPDSAFRIQSGQTLSLTKEGLYLAQADTTKAFGNAFRAESNAYPRYSRIEDLVGPLVYITTTEEFDQLKEAKSDKVKFDKVILDITRDRDRAKDFMRSYYKRVELANKYFTSYKEGWKTDQGMVYIIFGPPDNVTLGNETEIWFYKEYRTRFVFLRRGSIYDPEYYVLQRSKSYSELWYNSVDYWRKSRF